MSLTNHSYWNLNKNKKEKIFTHDLKINSENYLEVTNKLIPTGKIKNVKNTINDFTNFQNIGQKINIIKNKKIKRVSNTINQLGFDLTYCIKKNSKNYLASLKNKKTNTQLDFYSNLPGVQLYTSQGLRYKNKLTPYQGVCLETQHYPDSPNNKNFPNQLFRNYYTIAAYRFNIINNDILLEPSFLVRKHHTSKSITDLTTRIIYLDDYWTGLTYRTEGAGVFSFGFKINNMLITYSYDHSFSNEIMQYAYGTHEIGLGFRINTNATKRHISFWDY